MLLRFVRYIKKFIDRFIFSLGNLADIQKMGSFHDFLIELHSEFGPIASFYYGQKYCISLGSAETLRQVENCFDRPRK